MLNIPLQKYRYAKNFNLNIWDYFVMKIKYYLIFMADRK